MPHAGTWYGRGMKQNSRLLWIFIFTATLGVQAAIAAGDLGDPDDAAKRIVRDAGDSEDPRTDEANEDVVRLSDLTCEEARSRLKALGAYHFLRENPHQDSWIFWSPESCGFQEVAVSARISTRDRRGCPFGYVCVFQPSVSNREKNIDHPEARGCRDCQPRSRRDLLFQRRTDFDANPGSREYRRSSPDGGGGGGGVDSGGSSYRSDRAWGY